MFHKNKTFILHKIINSRLAKNQWLFIILFSSIITLIGTCFQLSVEYKDDVKYLDKQLSLIESSHLESLTSSLWTIDHKQIEIQLNNILSLRDIVYLEIVEKGKTIISVGKQPLKNAKLKTYPMIYNQQDEEVKIGDLQAWASLKGVYQRTLKRLFIILATQSFKTFIVSFFILFILYQKVIRHLIRLSNYTQKMTLDNLDLPFSLNRNKTNLPDELDSLVDMLNNMRKRLNNDIDIIKKADKALQESELRYRSLFKQNQLPMLLIDPETGNIIDSNSAASHYYGWPYEELIGKSIFKINTLTPKEIEREMQAAAHEKRNHFHFKHKLADGTVRDVEIYSCPVTINNHTFLYSLIYDITEQITIESEKVMLQKSLIQTQRMETIGTLAGGIAHDFNNILFPILGHSEMLLEDIPKDSPLKDSADQILTSVLRAKELVKQILTFSRQEKGELKMMKMQPIIKEALKLIRATIPTTIKISQDIRPDCGVIKADPTQIHQIVMNIATNAYHAMENTGGELAVKLKEVDIGESGLINSEMTPGLFACLTIADKGIGMDKELRNKIFDPFFTTKEQGKGTGMGLSVVHGIVTSMHGGIQIFSEPGKGTEFRIYFPLEKTYREQGEKTNQSIRGGTEHILLVDDEESIINMERKMLEGLGYQVTSRTNSIEALEAFQVNFDKFDVVISDLAMPNMAGEKLASEMLKIRPNIPIILNTGFSDKMTPKIAEKIGIKGILMKPIVKSELAQTIRKILDT